LFCKKNDYEKTRAEKQLKITQNERRKHTEKTSAKNNRKNNHESGRRKQTQKTTAENTQKKQLNY